MPENHGEPVGFTSRVAPDHIARLNRGDANQLIDYVLHQSQPEPTPKKAKITGWAYCVIALTLAVLVLTMFHRAGASTGVLLAAIAGWWSDRGYQQIMGAQHGRANAHITAIIADYARLTVEQDEQR